MSASIERGRFITLEGIDGAGKSTHLPWLKERLERDGRSVWATREPGGTPIGERLRELLLHESMTPLGEALLMFAVRREHCEHEIWPRLERGIWVVCDRFTDATYAYQGGGHALALDTIAALERVVLGDFRPDLTFVFDVPVALARERLAKERTLDKFEREQSEFFTRVRNVYLERARADPARVRIVDTSRPQPDVRAELDTIVAQLTSR